MDWGPMSDTSAAPTQALDTTMREVVSEEQPPANIEKKTLNAEEVRFIEFFAGDGGLSHAVGAAGVPVDEPQDLATGGVDFEKEAELEGVKSYLHELHVNGVNEAFASLRTTLFNL